MDMVRRILGRSAVGPTDGTSAGADMNAHNEIAARWRGKESCCRKTEGCRRSPRIGRAYTVIGGCAHLGVPAGYGSSAVTPPGAMRA